MTKEIPLTKGKVALVDDADFEWLSEHKWQAANPASSGHTIWYAKRWKETGDLAMHREIMGNPPGMNIDHINGNGLDNRRENLRICTHTQNMANRKKVSTRTTSSKYKGVNFSKRHISKPWGVWFLEKYQGRFATEEEAAHIWDSLAKEHWGAFARLNFPTPQSDLDLVGQQAPQEP